MKNTLLPILMFIVSIAWGQKPILPDFHADPSAHYWDGKYWIYPSTDEPGSTTWKQMKRWSCYSSTNLVDWKDEGEIFSLDDISWANDAAFAPDAVKWKGKYYFVFPASFQIGIAVSDKPNGPFVDAIGKPLIGFKELKGVNTFDPCLFVDEDHTPYIYYGAGGVGFAKMKDNMIELDGELQKLPLKYYHEGIWVHRYKNTYYFTYPRQYKNPETGVITQELVYSTAPTPSGPFTFCGTFLVNNSRNSHHSIIEIQGRWYLFYHIEGESAYERRVCVEYLEYDDKGRIKMVKMTKKGIKPLSH